ncbi:MAG: T9SS type A sorting domain-containing protein, partial [Flavobacteriales bacterium]|nr:T9SS type A sorting domain-containing protein [Flavobacteriales bacterium]
YNFPNPKSVRVVIRLDQFPDETTWQISSEDGTVLYSGGPYFVQGSTIDETFCIGSDLCYYFDIFDSASDGLCCDYGQGNYRLINGEDNSILAQGASFGASQRTTICNRPPGSPIPDPETIFGIYPNPSDQQATFVIKGHKDGTPRITLYDIQGRAVWQNLISVLEGEIAEVAFPSYLFNQGVYVAVVEVGGERYTERLVIAR